MAGALAALYGVGGLVYARNARRLLGRIGQAGLARLGALATCVSFGTMALATSWLWMPAACLLAGFGFYALHNTLQTHATQMVPAARGTAVSLFACSLFIGQSAGVSAAAFIVDRYSTVAVFAAAALGLLLLGMAFGAVAQQRKVI